MSYCPLLLSYYKPNSLYMGNYRELENDTSTLVDQEEREEIPLQEKEKEQ